MKQPPLGAEPRLAQQHTMVQSLLSAYNTLVHNISQSVEQNLDAEAKNQAMETLAKRFKLADVMAWAQAIDEAKLLNQPRDENLESSLEALETLSDEALIEELLRVLDPELAEALPLLNTHCDTWEAPDHLASQPSPFNHEG